MRVWLLTSEMPHEFAGGIARYVDNFARTLGSAGHETTVFFRTAQASDQRLAPGVRGIGIVPRFERLQEPAPTNQPDTHPGYPFNVMSYGPAFDFQMADEIVRWLGELPPPDVIESQEYCALPYYLLQRKLTEPSPLRSIPIVVHMHSAQFDLMRINQAARFRLPDYWLGQMEKFCIVAADGLLCPSHYLTRSIRATFRTPLDIRTLPLPFIADYDCPISPGTPDELVYVGRLEWRKGVPALVNACARLWTAGHKFRLTLIGGDTHFAPKGCTIGALLQQRHQRWIDQGRLRLLGQVRYTEVRDLVRQAWVALIPSHWENFPNTCIEPMAAGQLVLASTEGGQAEMVAEDGVNGFIFDWNVPGEFERQLLRVLALSVDQRAEIAQRGQRRIRSLCDPQLVLAQRIAHYEEVIARHKPRTLFPTLGCDGDAALMATGPAGVPATPAPNEQPGLLSVVIPYYNLGPYIEETLASVLGSTYTPLEAIIVNDGSTDSASLAKLREIEGRARPNVRVVHTENQGLATARNTGVAGAGGEYIALIDADDTVAPDFFARAIAVLDRYSNVGFVSSWVRYFDAAAGIWPTWNAEFPYLLGHNMNCVLCVLRRAAYQRIGGNNPAFAYNYEDYSGWVGLVAAGYVGVSLPYPLVNYRIRPGSMLRSMTDDQFMYLHDLMTQHYPEAYRRWGVELFNLQNANGPGRLWNHPALETGPASSGNSAAAQARISQLEQTRDWLEGQRRNYESAVEQQKSVIAELRQWVQDLQHGKDWLEGQRQQLTSALDELRENAAEQQARIAALDSDLQRERTARARTREICGDWTRQPLVRMLHRARLLRDLNVE